jgi:hypothetical protein
VFLGDAGFAWRWTSLPPEERERFRSSGVSEYSLTPWSRSMVKRWLDEAGLATGDRGVEDRVADVTGAWTFLIKELATRCKGSPHKYKDCLVEIGTEIATRTEWRHAFGLESETLPVLRAMAAIEDALSADDLCLLAPELGAERIRRVLEWADILALVRHEAKNRLNLDSVVRRVLGAGLL